MVDISTVVIGTAAIDAIGVIDAYGAGVGTGPRRSAPTAPITVIDLST
ncbi:hypothetical protein [Streptomyces sp. NPDC049887]